eukprot:TRINITY_DN3427_c0_g2_i1.p1 TRINITY_DN3427_c0_g2~~TRINITY_DN3427_c0_g2_i1.p1  ORF type:complete len:616 (-),score=141.73 TRINITY_DN3427_c0_g2_i1:254-2101(-)
MVEGGVMRRGGGGVLLLGVSVSVLLLTLWWCGGLSFWTTALAGALAAVVLVYWCWTPPLSSDVIRPFGGFEYVFHDIVKINGAHNISVLASFRHVFDEMLVKQAMQELQRRHALLAAHVVNEYGSVPVFKHCSDPQQLCVVKVVHRQPDMHSLEKSLEEELNTPTACMRCLLVLDPKTTHNARSMDNEEEVKSELGLTVRHDIMDGKSAALLFAELIGIYTELYKASASTPASAAKTINTDAKQRPTATHTPSPPPTVPIPPSVDTVLAQKWPPLVLTLLHVGYFLWLNYFFFVFPSRLPHSSTPQAARAERINNKVTTDSLWQTGLIHTQISEEETELLLGNCKSHNTTMGCLLYAAALAVTAKLIFAENKNKSWARIWGVMVVDVRGHLIGFQQQLFASKHKTINSNNNNSSSNTTAAQQEADVLSPQSLGIFISTLDFMDWVSKATYESDLWFFATKMRKEIADQFRKGKQFSSIVAGRLLTYYAAFFSSRFWSPHPCPSFSFSNLGSLDPPKTSTTATSTSASVAPKDTTVAHLLRNLDGGFPFVSDVRVGVTTGTSFPVPLVTSLTYNQRLRITLSYPKETMSRAYAQSFADGLVAHLHSAVEAAGAIKL